MSVFSNHPAKPSSNKRQAEDGMGKGLTVPKKEKCLVLPGKRQEDWKRSLPNQTESSLQHCHLGQSARHASHPRHKIPSTAALRGCSGVCPCCRDLEFPLVPSHTTVPAASWGQQAGRESPSSPPQGDPLHCRDVSDGCIQQHICSYFNVHNILDDILDRQFNFFSLKCVHKPVLGKVLCVKAEILGNIPVDSWIRSLECKQSRQDPSQPSV